MDVFFAPYAGLTDSTVTNTVDNSLWNPVDVVVGVPLIYCTLCYRHNRPTRAVWFAKRLEDFIVESNECKYLCTVPR